MTCGDLLRLIKHNLYITEYSPADSRLWTERASELPVLVFHNDDEDDFDRIRFRGKLHFASDRFIRQLSNAERDLNRVVVMMMSLSQMGFP